MHMHLQLDHVTARYGEFYALSDVSLQLEAKELYAVVGPNGGGKSTLLKLLMGLVSPSSGTIHGAKHLRKNMAYLPQQTELDKSFPISVYDVVAMGLWKEIGPFNGYPKDAASRIFHVLDEVGMTAFSTRPIGALSGGQLQRVLFARLALQDAHLILLDEPFNNLDQPTIEDLMAQILKWHEQGKTIIVALHDLDIVKKCFPKTILLARHLIAAGETADVMTVDHFAASYACARQWGQ